MRIIVVCFLHLDEIPPVITILKVLSSKYNVLYIGVDDLNDRFRTLFGSNISFINILGIEEPKEEGLIGKVKRFLYWKIYRLKQRKAASIIEKEYKKSDLVWIQHEYTLMGMRRIHVPYYLTMYELHQDLYKKKSELINRIKRANKVIVPEYTRAHIVQACAGLNCLPLVIQNKPFEYDNRQIYLPDNPMDNIVHIAHASNKMVVLYSGIFLRERKLDTFIESVAKLNDKFVMVFVGRKSEYLDELLSKYRNVIYLGFYNPPQHLSIIEKSDIGILTYVANNNSINPVFCAPNKIWEYARFGKPMICNDIPGLKYTVEYNKMGYCCDINSVDDICRKLEQIYNHYSILSKNASLYYLKVNIEKDICKVLEN